MIGALWTGISGLSSHQTALDNESHNISNVNTVGYKSSRISFADQMYQDRIGKGSKILDAEKLYVQGNLKLTGVDYDMALSGDGFFTVLNTATNGTSEILYTRAGNFRMGDNGTLQDSAGNEVQGWAMSAIDKENDVSSTNPNISMFTSDYSKILGNKVVRHSNYIETYAAKATDYTVTAKGDASSVFEGTGVKSKAAKISDVEALITDYSNWLQRLKEEPDGGSASSIAQISQVNFKSYDSLNGTDNGLIKKDGDQVYIYIDGTKYSQSFVTASKDFDGNGTITDEENIKAGRIATYKALADKISEIPGLKAYTVSESNGTHADTLEETDIYALSTQDTDTIKGIIQIESLIPGKAFTISEVGEESGSTTFVGSQQTTTFATQGTGIGAIESAKEALAKVLTGKQQDVYGPTELGFGQTDAGGGTLQQIDYKYSISIYDKDLKETIPVPNDGAPVPQAVPIEFSLLAANNSDLDTFITNFKATDGWTGANNTSPKLSDYIDILNINGNLVIQTKDNNYDVEFSGNLSIDTGVNGPDNTFDPVDKNNNFSGREGAGAEFIEIVNKIEQTTTQSSLQLKLDTLGISDSAFGAFSVDNSGVITMKQDGVDFAIGQVSVALFNNKRGLNPSGDNLLAKTNESGEPIYNLNNEKTAKIEAQTLELSTADLSESLVNLMVFQRAFEANAKSITTSDELLNTLINLKR